MNIEQIYNQLSPRNKQIIDQLISNLAAQDGLTFSMTATYKPPIDNLVLWVGHMRAQGKSLGTIHGYELAARRILLAIPTPTYMDLQQYFSTRLSTVSAATVSFEQKSIKSLFKYLNKQGLYPSDPSADIELVREPDKQVEFPKPEQLEAVFTFVPARRTDRAKYRLAVVLLATTGIRINEACSLRRDMINYRAFEITVLGKGNKERTIPIPPITAELLHDWVTKECPSDSKYVFPGDTISGYWDVSGMQGMMAKACDRAKVKRISPHKLRHYFATKTLEHGAKLEIISKILGHTNVSITAKVYRHIQLAEMHKEMLAHDPIAGTALQLTTGPVIEGTAKLLPPIKEDNA